MENIPSAKNILEKASEDATDKIESLVDGEEYKESKSRLETIKEYIKKYTEIIDDMKL